MKRSWIAAAVAAGSLMGIGTAAQAVPAVVATGPGGFVVQSAPPAPMYEVAPPARAGYIWSPGHYQWRDGRYVWTPGTWMERREGYAWQPPRWEQRGPDHWVLVGGHWVRMDNYSYRTDDDRIGRRGPDGDLDGDGILNRDDRDRDGDGVRNRDDDFPNDPTRS